MTDLPIARLGPGFATPGPGWITWEAPDFDFVPGVHSECLINYELPVAQGLYIVNANARFSASFMDAPYTDFEIMMGGSGSQRYENPMQGGTVQRVLTLTTLMPQPGINAVARLQGPLQDCVGLKLELYGSAYLLNN